MNKHRKRGTEMENVPEPTGEIRRAYAKGRRDAMKEVRDPPYQTRSNYEVVQSYWTGWHYATENMNITRIKNIPR